MFVFNGRGIVTISIGVGHKNALLEITQYATVESCNELERKKRAQHTFKGFGMGQKREHISVTKRKEGW